MTRSDFQQLSRLRLREARGLFNLRYYDGAYYLAGYAVECALKACIARQTQRYDFPEKERVRKSYSHSARELLQVADLWAKLQEDTRARPNLGASWEAVYNWSEQSRYSFKDRLEAETLLRAVTKKPDGVLVWTRQYW